LDSELHAGWRLRHPSTPARQPMSPSTGMRRKALLESYS
jgi:hypothetical protein